MPDKPVDAPEEAIAEEEPTRIARGEKNIPSSHSVATWISVADRITDYPSHLAAGAMAHAGFKDDDILSREDFIRACEEFEKVEAF